MMWPLTYANMEPRTDVGLTANLHDDDVEFH
jgi:hypothetical protein